MFPVEAFPRVNVCLFVVPITPSPESVIALSPELAEIEAVGVPPATFRNPNLAEVVDVAPTRTSRVFENGEIAPLLSCQ